MHPSNALEHMTTVRPICGNLAAHMHHARTTVELENGMTRAVGTGEARTGRSVAARSRCRGPHHANQARRPTGGRRRSMADDTNSLPREATDVERAVAALEREA